MSDPRKEFEEALKKQAGFEVDNAKFRQEAILWNETSQQFASMCVQFGAYCRKQGMTKQQAMSVANRYTGMFLFKPMESVERGWIEELNNQESR